MCATIEAVVTVVGRIGFELLVIIEVGNRLLEILLMGNMVDTFGTDTDEITVRLCDRLACFAG